MKKTDCWFSRQSVFHSVHPVKALPRRSGCTPGLRRKPPAPMPQSLNFRNAILDQIAHFFMEIRIGDAFHTHFYVINVRTGQ